jgi:hypothetical protein
MAISNNSTGLRTGVCTSTTRPTAPYAGQKIYETDTKNELTWDGSAWSKPWNMPRGVVVYVTSYSNSFPSGVVSGLTTTFTAENNRQYKITIHVSVAIQSGRHLLTLSTTSLDSQRIQDFSITGFPHAEGSLITIGNGTSQTVTATFTTVSGTMNLASDSGPNKHFLLIEDIGPA